LGAAQVDHVVQLAAFCVVENVPEAQLVHTRSAVLLPAVSTYLPALQFCQVWQLAAFWVVLNLPAAHGLQVRSVVAFPADWTNWPAAHVVLGTQGVAGSWSSSQLFELHATSSACPPAQ
jgi:hypothetical protein